MAIIMGGSSFTSLTPNSQINVNQGLIFPVYFTINQVEPINGTNCTATIHLSGSFNYNPITHAVTNVQINAPTVTVNCGSNVSRVVYPDTPTINFDAHAHVSQLTFSKTGDGEVDGVLSDSGVISNMISDINSQIDSQI
jgi:hypothetical protein